MDANNKVHVLSIHDLSSRDRLKRDIKNTTYSMPGVDNDSGGINYTRILQYCDKYNIPYELKSVNELNLCRSGESVNDYQGRYGISQDQIETIEARYKNERRIVWAGFCLETKDNDGNVIHPILSGYHRDTFCEDNGIEFHFISIVASERHAGKIANISNARDMDAAAPITELEKKKTFLQQTQKIMKELNIEQPLSKAERTTLEVELKNDMKESYLEYKLPAQKARLTALVNATLDEFSTVEDSTRFTLKAGMDARAKVLELTQAIWQQKFPGETFEENSYKDRTLQLLSVSQPANFMQRLDRMTREAEYRAPFARGSDASIHLAIAIERKGGEEGAIKLTKKTIDDKSNAFINMIKNLNNNKQWKTRDKRPIIERILIVNTFEGQECTVQDWVNPRKDFIES